MCLRRADKSRVEQTRADDEINYILIKKVTKLLTVAFLVNIQSKTRNELRQGTRDLKSLGSNTVPVQVRSAAPNHQISQMALQWQMSLYI